MDSSVDLTVAPVQEEGASSLAIEPYFIRTDSNGRSYCMVAGEDGLLEKRFIRIGAMSWGTVTIESGLRAGDLIAFPYGDNVVEGAETIEVDMLSATE